MPLYAALSKGTEGAVALAEKLGGSAYVAVPGQNDPAFGALVIGGDQAALAARADLGLYAVHVRAKRHQPMTWTVGQPTPGVVAVFGMHRKPELTHAQSDAHWSEVHAPLALIHHPGMWDYHQVSVDEVISGHPYDGFALCAFASEYDLKERFFNGPDSQIAIRDDVAKFADMANSPRRVRMTEYRFAPE